jgi:hypothetical protein
MKAGVGLVVKERLCLIAMLVVLTLTSFSHTGKAAETRLVRQSNGVVRVFRDSQGRALRPTQTQTESSNWSGYVLPNFETNQTYTSATANWTISPVIFDPEDSIFGVGYEYSSTWVGIGGYCEDSACLNVDKSLIQLGTEQDAFSDGTTQYYAWYEKLPGPAKLIKKLPILAGDTVTASLGCIKHCTKKKQTWTLTLTDTTSGKSWGKSLKYKGSELSAEWIEEAPYGREFKHQIGVLPLADFGTVSFTSSTINGAAADLGTGDSIILDDQSDFGNPDNFDWGQTSNVSTPNATLDGFNACWGSNDVFTTPCNPD